ncbi:MAG: beta-Ala-His dipeptidase [Candidatus Thorarchaeota archaeon]|jgi:dipeptidase D
MVLENLEPKLVWQIFEEVFTQTPRASKKEDKIRAKIKEYVQAKSDAAGLTVTISEDETGNILLKTPATKGMEKAPPILLQGHMDMVCETDRPDGFDFDNNPIPVRIQDNGEWIDADGTTLGADNGIGSSIGIALVLDPNVAHGPLEVLITVDEETGLVGAFGLDLKKLGIESKLMMNIDSEDLGVITIGSAGGGDTTLTKKLNMKDVTGEAAFYDLSVSGLFGGHSGVDIHEPRANANKLIARMLTLIVEKMNVHLCSWNGGSKHNAIARESVAKFAVETGRAAETEKLLEEASEAIFAYYKYAAPGATPLEPDIKIEWKESEPALAFSLEESKKIIQLVNVIPHGPIRFSPSVKGLVETSNNLAIIKTDDSEISVLMSTRSSVDSELDSFRKAISDLAQLGGWDVTQKTAYPGWNPEPKSPFLAYVRSHLEKVSNSEVKVEAIHAGLECGIIGSKIPGIQMVSIGPRMENPHTPDERLRIADVGILYNVMKSILKDLGSL